MSEEAQQERREEGGSRKNKDGDSGSLGKLVVGLFLVFFLPAVLLGVSMYFILLRKLRQKISVVFTFSLILDLIAVTIWYASGAWDRVLFVFQNIRDISLYWTDLLPALIAANLLIGSIFGFIIIFWEVRQMKSNPHRLQLEGSWMYQFKFRRTPVEAYRRKKKIENLKAGKYLHPDKIALGIDEDDNIVYRYNTEMHQSTLLSGTTGSGKTITMLNSMYSDICNGVSFVVIDFKRSAEFSAKLAKWSEENGRSFYHFVNGKPEDYDIPGSPGQAYYDPLKNAGSAKADTILGMREYDTAADVYKTGMRELLSTLLPLIDKANRNKTKNIRWDEGEIYKINSIVNGLNGSTIGNLSELVDAIEGGEAEIVARNLEVKVKNTKSSLHNAFLQLQGQMQTLVNSEYGRWLKYEKDARNIDLFKLLKDPGNVVLFSMDGESEKDFAKYMGSLILSDLSSVSAARRRKGISDHVNLYIDEFQALSPTSLAPLLEKSRASGFGVTMASQSYEQIISAAAFNGEAQLNSILDTCANFIVHAGATERSAERLSNIVGKEKKTVYRQANQNESFIFSFNWKNRRNQMIHTSTETDWISPPSSFMNLSLPKKANGYKTTAVMIKKSSDDPSNVGKEGTVVKKIWMIPNDKVLEEYFTSIEKDEEDNAVEVETEEEVEENDNNDSYEEYLPEQDFDMLEAPLDYMGEKGYHQDLTPGDELDYLDPHTLEEDEEIVDGDFGFEVIEEEDDRELLNSINLDALEINQNSRKEAKSAPPVVDYDEDYDDEEELEMIPKESPKLQSTRIRNESAVNNKQIASSRIPSKLPTKPSLPTSLPKVPKQQVRPAAEPPTNAPVGRSAALGAQFGSLIGDQDFKPAKRRKERPPIVDDDDDLEGDALPDF